MPLDVHPAPPLPAGVILLWVAYLGSNLRGRLTAASFARHKASVGKRSR